MQSQRRTKAHAAILVGGLGLAVALASCKQPPDETPKLPPPPAKAPTPSTPSSTPSVAAKISPVTQAEAEAFAKELAAAVPRCVRQPATVGPLIDFETLIRGALEKVDLPLARRETYLQAARDGDFGAKVFCDGITADTSYVLLRVRPSDDGPRPLFRRLGTGGLAYQELILGKRDDGKVRVIDWYAYATGEKISQYFANNVLPSNSEIVKLEREQEASFAKLDAAYRAKKWAEAKPLFDALPPHRRNQKGYWVMSVHIAAGLGAEQGDAALAAFAQAFPDDPSVDLVTFEVQMAQNKLEPLLATIDRIDQRVGGDPYLDVVRASIYLEQKIPDKALASAEKATTAEPTMVDAWNRLMRAQLETKKFDALVPTLNELATRFHLNVRKTVEADPAFEPFRASPVGIAWLAATPPAPTAGSATAPAPAPKVP